MNSSITIYKVEQIYAKSVINIKKNLLIFSKSAPKNLSVTAAQRPCGSI